MPDDGYQAWVQVLPDFSELDRRADSHVTSTLGRAGSSGAAAFGGGFRTGVGQIFSGNFLANIATDLVSNVISGVSTAVTAGINYAADGIRLASGLGEQVNAVQVAYGELGDEVLALSKQAPANLNLTQAAFNRLAVRFSAFAKTIAGAGGNVGKVVDDLTKRGADFASVYDLEASEALELFQSGLAGETEPLRRFGVDLSAAAVEAFAYANGIAAAGEELTEQEKVQARYGALLAQTSLVQGDLQNTSGSLANQQRELNVQFEEAQTKLGQFLLPGFTSIVTFANDSLLPKLGEITEKIGPILGQAMEDAAPQVQLLLDKITPLVEQFAVSVAEDGIPAFLDLMGQITDAAPGWAEAFNALTTPENPLDRFNQGLIEASDGLHDAWEGWISTYLDFSESLGTDVSAGRQFLEDWGRDIPEGFEEGMKSSTGFAGANTYLQEQLAAIAAREGAGGGGGGGGGRAVGVAIGDGLIAGMNARKDAVRAAAEALARSAEDAARKQLGIQSPSKVFEEIGAYTAEGFFVGMDKVVARTPLAIPGISGHSVSVAPAGTTGASVLPQAVTLIDRDGSLLGHMDVRVEQYDKQQSTARSMGSRGV